MRMCPQSWQIFSISNLSMIIADTEIQDKCAESCSQKFPTTNSSEYEVSLFLVYSRLEF